MATLADFFKAVSAATPTADAVKIFEQQFAPQVQVPFIPGLTDFLKRVSANTPSAEAVKTFESQFKPQPYVPPQAVLQATSTTPRTFLPCPRQTTSAVSCLRMTR